MTSRSITTRLLIFPVLMMLAAAFASAAVTSDPVTYPAKPDGKLYILLNLNSDDLVSGVQGQLNYDPTYFSNPDLNVHQGARTFIGQGNEVAPGAFRFVIYADPTSAITLSLPTAVLYLDISPDIPPGQEFTLTYSDERAARPDGSSYGDAVDFAPVTILSNETPARHWMIYE